MFNQLWGDLYDGILGQPNFRKPKYSPKILHMKTLTAKIIIPARRYSKTVYNNQPICNRHLNED